jgi:hypothetical protein
MEFKFICRKKIKNLELLQVSEGGKDTQLQLLAPPLEPQLLSEEPDPHSADGHRVPSSVVQALKVPEMRAKSREE